MQPDADSAYAGLVARSRERHLLESTSDLLGWDREVMMPAGGGELRARQLELLARLTHERAVDPRLEELLETAGPIGDDSDDPRAADIRLWRREHRRARCLPSALVGELAEVQSLAQGAWAEAREHDDFARFRPWLERVVALLRRKADHLHEVIGGEPWDALADEFEPELHALEVERLFTPLRPRLLALLDTLRGAAAVPDDAFHHVELPIAAQERFVHAMAAAIGFDLGCGRIDRAAHPFCSGTHPGDVRLATRFQPAFMADALGSTLHEAGHGLYEQGLPVGRVGLPSGRAVSLGVHESQSRLWENHVGKSLGFWQFAQPRLREFFGGALDRFDAITMQRACHRVEPSWIRVEADEVTYDLHVMLRFELERSLIDGRLAVADLPEAWNATFARYLGLEVPDDRRGCLQDVHWSCGLFGYFPTYTLGNVYSAQLFAAATAELGDLEPEFAAGRFTALREWLRQHVHQPGSLYPAHELIERATGRPASVEPMLELVERRHRAAHGL